MNVDKIKVILNPDKDESSLPYDNEMFDEVEKICCPWCGEAQGIELCEFPELVTYHGENNIQECECVVCEKKFKITEMVSRDWEVSR